MLRKPSFRAFLIYSVCTALFFWPVFSVFSSHLIGPPEDNTQFFWFLWYGAESLWRPDWAFLHSNMIYFPEGVNLLYANYFYFGVFVSAVAHIVLPYVTLFNLFILASFVFAGVGAYRLAMDITGDETASLVAGFIFAFNPSHFAHALHHVTIASIQFIPWFMLYYLRAMKNGRVGDALRAAVFIVLSALCDWNYLVYIFIFMALHQLFFALKARSLLKRETVLSVAAFAVAVLALMPLLWPMIQAGKGGEFAVNAIGPKKSVADLLGFIVPGNAHLLSNLPVVRAVNATHDWSPWEKVVYLGWANLLLVLWGRKGIDKRFLFGMLGFLLLSLGSVLHVYGKELPVVLPYAVMEHIPFFKNARNPSRTIVFSYLFLSVLVAQAICFLKTSGRLKRISIALIATLIFADFYSVCAQTTSVKLPPAYRPIVEEPVKDFAIINLPWDGGRYMMYQTMHGIPDVQGYVGRKKELSLINRLPYNGNWVQQKQMLIDNKVKYVVLHKYRIYTDPKSGPEAFKQAMERFAGVYSRVYEKVYEDDSAATFRVY